MPDTLLGLEYVNSGKRDTFSPPNRMCILARDTAFLKKKKSTHKYVITHCVKRQEGKVQGTMGNLHLTRLRGHMSKEVIFKL